MTPATPSLQSRLLLTLAALLLVAAAAAAFALDSLYRNLGLHALEDVLDAQVMPWIGLRTSAPGGAHVEYFRGIANPIAVKVGEGTEAATLAELVRILNPDNEPGRLTLIHRFGATRIESALPAMIRAVRDTDRQVLWVCDPMHGNTESTPQGIKTRRFENILAEVESAFRIHGA